MKGGRSGALTGHLFVGQYRAGATYVWAPVTVVLKAGAPSDADYEAAPPDGTMALDTTNSRLYVRVGAAWKYAALT